MFQKCLMYGASKPFHWKSFERRNSIYLTLVKHQNTKIWLQKLSEKYWVNSFIEIFGSVRKNLQLTVFLDHHVEQCPLEDLHILEPGPFFCSSLFSRHSYDIDKDYDHDKESKIKKKPLCAA